MRVFHRDRGRGIVVADSAGVARRGIRLLHPRAMRGFLNPAGAIQPDFFYVRPFGSDGIQRNVRAGRGPGASVAPRGEPVEWGP